MAYEIDFIGVKDIKDNADAMALRWTTEDNNGYIVGVIDGGYKDHGEELVNILNEYYFKDEENKVIDFMVCTHADKDHASGLLEVINNFEVKALYVNIPWYYTDELLEYKKYKQTTSESLTRKLKETFRYLDELEQAAAEKGIKIYKALAGVKIEDKLTILSPTKRFFIESVITDERMALLEMAKTAAEALPEEEMIDAEWDEDYLDGNEKTTVVNEASVVIFGDLDDGILLTADAGYMGLGNAYNYANSKDICLKDSVKIYKIPHHGGRHDLNTSILNNIVGDKIKKGDKANKKAFVMCGVDSDHPKKVTVNAFITRGVNVYVTKGKTINHHVGDMPKRKGWSSVSAEGYHNKIEK